MSLLNSVRRAIGSLLRGIWNFILSLPIWLGLVKNTGKENRLKKLISEPEKRQENFINEEWLGNLLDVDQRAHGYKSMYYILRFVAVVGGVLLPFFAVGGRNIEVTSLLSVVVAASVGWEAAFRYGEKWQLFRRMSVELESAGVLFLEKFRRGQSAVEEKEFLTFVERVQRILKKKVEAYGDIVDDAITDENPPKGNSASKAKSVSEDVVDSFEEEPPSSRVRPAPKPRKP